MYCGLLPVMHRSDAYSSTVTAEGFAFGSNGGIRWLPSSEVCRMSPLVTRQFPHLHLTRAGCDLSQKVCSRSGRLQILFDFSLLKIEEICIFCFCQIERRPSASRSSSVSSEFLTEAGRRKWSRDRATW